MGSVSSPRPCLQSRVSPQAVRPHQVNQPPTIDLWPHAPAASHTDRQRAGGSPGCVTGAWDHSEGFPGPVAESRSPTATLFTLVHLLSCWSGSPLAPPSYVCLQGSGERLGVPVPTFYACACFSFWPMDLTLPVGSPPTSVTGIVGSMGASASWDTQSQPTGKTATAH